MNTKQPRLLDLFSGAGGAGMGYMRAGFDVVGVDKEPMPRYPGEFVQDDALTYLLNHWHEFDAVHASPPCQFYAGVTKWRGNADDHPDLVVETIRMLDATGLPWVVENVPEAPVRRDYLLCGTQFGLRVKRHRAFQVGGWTQPYTLLPACNCYRNPEVLPFMHKGERAYADALGCGWMTNREGRQAIPPAFTEYIGTQLLEAIKERAA